MTIVEMCVHIDCAGCEAKVKKALQRLPGVDDVDIDMEMQKVTVMGWADKNQILKTVRKMGKRAELWPYPYNPEYHGFIRQYNNNNIINTDYDYTKKNIDYDSYEYDNNYESEFSDHHVTSYSPIPSSPSTYRRASSYNYYTHGYNNGDDFGYYQQPIGSSLVNQRAVTMFNDDNPHACSIM
ncbi:hypothetical protein QN277_020343 [Acacia crassicarpa]|uniref:HMA domain-containing protein n=1 Tax=Acacia crassicarpa TaxID=499986 RepID=A0AAE1MSK4_9FABA|nr:hypothetical protein QN277_020343 [Acacia crassicarpa]